MVIRNTRLLEEKGHRNIVLIPDAHGTNPASVTMAGMKCVVVSCDENGNVDAKILNQKWRSTKTIYAYMITYPSAHF